MVCPRVLHVGRKKITTALKKRFVNEMMNFFEYCNWKSKIVIKKVSCKFLENEYEKPHAKK